MQERTLIMPGADDPDAIEAGAGHRGQAAQGPVPAPVSAAENPAPVVRADLPPEARPAEALPAEAMGRRTLSTAFVRVGPDGHLTVTLRNGRVLVLRGVVMNPKNYCGVQVPAGARYCGNYWEVAAARPGGAPASGQPDPDVRIPAEAAGGATRK